ncbi:MAG: hypothetical protein U9M90_02100 [Patescibacteria group bacterium]|nr:hypothetical protein [Patescibacteria group bacterium]
MPEQDNASEGLHKQEVSDALKKVVESPEHSKTKPEDIGKSEDQQRELNDIAQKNQEMVKKQEQQEQVAEHVQQKIKQQTAASDDGDDESKEEIREQTQEIMSIQDADQQIEKIIELATRKDPYFAIKIAQKLDDNFILDEVHDELIEDKVRKVLVSKGLLKGEL